LNRRELVRALLNDSAALFASIMLRRRIRLEHKRSPEATPSELIDAVFDKEAYRGLYDLAFPYPRSPYSLSLKLSLAHLRGEFKLKSVHERPTRQRREVSLSPRSAILLMLMIGQRAACQCHNQ
jgi:hypothetical protein